ncbi:MAG: ribosomal protein [Candidatus Parcubacteria bacterium]|jgi:small subunit ribosomal protein S4
MGRRLEAKCKQCRREGEKLYLKGERCFTAKCAMNKRPFKPGQHGPTSRTRPTPYGVQLREKQKVKNTYGLMERQFRGYYDKAKRKTGNTGDFLVQALEMRLDNLVFRLGLGRSRAMSRQMVNHGNVLVNGKKVTIPSYQTKAGDIITLTANVLKGKLHNEGDTARIEKHQVPGWLHLEAKAKTGKVLNRPEGADLKQNFDPKLIVEFYSR